MRHRLGWLAGSVRLAGVLVLALASPAMADRAFAPRFSTNASGDIAVVGNTLETCSSAAADCANARQGKGAALNNNSFVMERVDIDGTGLDSSSARLSLPAGAHVLFAGLYYGARTTAGTRGKAAPDPSAAGLRRVDLRAPGAAAFERLTSEVDTSSEVSGAYSAFVNVTDQVRRAGPGVYTVAGVQAATGEDRYAGWALVVAYEAADQAPRNLTVFDGLQSVTQGKPALTIPVSGFQTPLSGPVRTRLGFVAYEGDRGLTGDSAALDGRALSDAVTPANNFFNSTISAGGRDLTDKTPDYVNQLGFDAKVVGIDGYLANGATSAKIALKTSSDQYLPQVITFATDLYAPVIHATKTVENLTHPDGPTQAGDLLRYTLSLRNDGLEAARNFVLRDVLPAEVTYEPGSLRIADIPAGEATPTDLPGDDLGEYDAGSRAVRFFLGTGAGPGQGGEIAAAGAAGDHAAVSFEARVDENLASERDITNAAQATFVAPTLATELTALSAEATVHAAPTPREPPPADLGLTDTETVAASGSGGDVIDSHITIDDHGPADATDVVVHEDLPPGSTVESAAVDGGTCTSEAGGLTCTLPHLDSGGSAEIGAVIREPSPDAGSGSRTEATVTAAQPDPTPANNSRDATGPSPTTAASAIDLAVADHLSAASVPLGGTLTETIIVNNHGPGAATGLDLTGALNGAAQVLALAPGAASCTSTLPLHCTVGSLPAGATATVELVLRPLRAGRLTDAAEVSADQPETTYANNVATVSATVVRRTTAGAVQIVPVEPVTSARSVVEFVLTAAVIRPTPGITPSVCVTLPARLSLSRAPGGGLVSRSRVCWDMTDLVSGRPQVFRFFARVGAVPRSGASFSVGATLTGANFAPRRARATVEVPPQPVACPSRARPRARAAC